LHAAGRARRRAALRGIALAAALAGAGCSLDYQEGELQEKLAEDIPDTVAVNLVHKIHKDGRLTIVLEAARAETYSSKNQTILTGAHFIEYGANKEKSTEGEGGTVVFHTDTENAEIWGGVQVHSASEEGDISADSLSWQHKVRLLTAPPQEKVTIKKDDGSSITGTGFRGDFRKREVTFSGPVQGTYVSKKKE